MNDVELAAMQLADQAQRLFTFTGLQKQGPHDRLFLVMGMTGSGKSTFVSRCTGKNAVISHGLYSCTSSIDVFDFNMNGRRIYLVDTPGFNDTTRSDIETLGILATYLSAMYANRLRIHGIIMLHPITANRMSGSSMRNIEMMKAMCGFSVYENLLIATTMWPEAASRADKKMLENREVELLGDDRFFGALVSRGATVLRHNEGGRRNTGDEVASARRLVAHLVRHSDSRNLEALRLQREIIDQKKTLGDTTAGIAVAGELFKARRAHERQLQEIKKQTEGQMAKLDARYAAELAELRADVEKDLKKTENEKRELKKSMKELHSKEEKAWMKRIEKMDRQFRQHLAEKEEQIRDMEESLSEIREDIARRPRKSSRKGGLIDEAAEYEKVIEGARKEVESAKVTHSKFSGQTGNLVNGVSNGVAAGAVSGIIGAVAAGGFLCTVM